MLLKPTMVLKLAAPLVLVALVQPASAVQIKRVGTDSGVVLRLRGDVKAGDYGTLKSIQQNGAVVGLEIRSDGGSLEEGLDIARVVRDKGLVVYASEKCLHKQTSDRQFKCYPESAMSELIFIVFCSTSKMTAVDHPNIRAPFIAVMGPSSFQSSTGVTSP